MDETAYKSLTRSERAVLTLLSREQEVGEVAVALGLTASTVETYIKSARRKLGGVGRYVAARELREYEASRNKRSPDPGLFPDAGDDSAGVAGGARMPRQQDRVQEEAVVFRFSDDVKLPEHSSRGLSPRSVSVVLLRLLMVVSIALAIAALLLLSIPLGEGAQRLANIIDPPHGP